jgi:ligand-binding SRPBCC domain-containing protein
MYVLERSQLVSAPLEETFRFFEDPHNLGRITPEWLGLRIVRIDPPPLREGFQIEYRIRWLGFPVRWQALIAEYEPGRRFVDLQTEGPYRSWRHEHTFEDWGGQTLMRDRVEYELPFGLLGRAVHRLMIAGKLRQIFDYRAAKVDLLFSK